jgi:hypothetical protein
MSEARIPNPLIEQFRRGGVPAELRLLAAQGALPLKPTDLLELVHFLLSDPAEDVRVAAAATLQALPVGELLAIFRDRQTPPELLAWGLTGRAERDLQEALLQNHSTPDAALQQVAAVLAQDLAELVVINQTRLLRSTPLLEALEANAGLNNDQRRRLRELRESFQIGVETEPPAAPAAPAPEAQAEPLAEEPEPPPPRDEAEALSRYLSDDERGDDDKVSAVQRIYLMSAAQKVMCALKGNREERTILVRDPNRLVSSAVLGSPRLTDAEIEGFAAMKNVSDEVLRRIGTHRDWIKRYPVVSNLVRNPRTPVGVALPLVSRLNPRDLRGLAIDRNVPEVIRRHARKFVHNVPGGQR